MTIFDLPNTEVIGSKTLDCHSLQPFNFYTVGRKSLHPSSGVLRSWRWLRRPQLRNRRRSVNETSATADRGRRHNCWDRRVYLHQRLRSTPRWAPQFSPTVGALLGQRSSKRVDSSITRSIINTIRCTSRHHLESYLAEFMWRKHVGGQNVFEALLQSIMDFKPLQS